MWVILVFFFDLFFLTFYVVYTKHRFIYFYNQNKSMKFDQEGKEKEGSLQDETGPMGTLFKQKSFDGNFSG